MEGWWIREQMLEIGDWKVPLNLQNRPLTVQGWRFNERGLLVGSFLTSRFVDPTVIAEV